MKDLLASLRALESSQRSDVVTQGGIQMLREAIAHRKANPQPGDPR
jgi:hypothetical protein